MLDDADLEHAVDDMTWTPRYLRYRRPRSREALDGVARLLDRP
jgi:hypothetical protein